VALLLSIPKSRSAISVMNVSNLRWIRRLPVGRGVRLIGLCEASHKAEKVADFSRFGSWSPAARMAGTPSNAGVSSKKKARRFHESLYMVPGGIEPDTR
jgi:hypothetical protein